MNEADFKAAQLARWCSELAIRSSEVAIVGDGASDLQLASVAGFVIAIGKDSELAPRADVVLGEDEYGRLADCFTTA
jgi:phosphoserine phosphatase